MRRALLFVPTRLLPAAIVLIALLLSGCATTVATRNEAAVSAELLEIPLSTTGTASQEARARQLFIRGMTRAYLGEHEAAVDLYNEALQLAPQEAAILSALAEAYAALDDLPSALFYAEQGLALAPENRYYHEQMAALHLRAGDAPRAAAIYRALLARDPADLEALYELARLQATAGTYQEALATYEQLLEQIGDTPEIRRQMLQLYTRMEDTAGQERTLRALIAQEPENDTWSLMLSELYARQDRLEPAITILEEFLVRHPGDAETTLALADLHRRRGEDGRAEQLLQRLGQADQATPEQLVARAAALTAGTGGTADSAAIDLLHRALEQDADNVEALLLLGTLSYRAGRFEAAGEALYDALQQNPRDPLIWAQTASAFLQAGHARRAAEVADEGLLLFPGNLELLRLAGYGLMHSYQNAAARTRFDDLLALLEEADAAHPEEVDMLQADVFAALALLHARRKDDAAADSLYARALAADPEHAEALNNYAYSLAERGLRLDEARQMARRAVDLEPNNPSFLDTLGWVYFRRGDLQEAQHWIQKAIEADSASAAVYEHYGDVLHAMGNTAAARTYWQQALELNPESASLPGKLKR